jgi:RNA polymerase sigma factor (TIGR02999 family)
LSKLHASRSVASGPDLTRSDITDLLSAWRNGDSLARDQLLERIYPRLHAMAVRQVARSSRDLSLSATELVNEVYLKLVGSRQPDYEDRLHFFGISARLMRDILVDQARRRHSQKRGGGAVMLELGTASEVSTGDHPPMDVLALHESLSRLEEVSSTAVRVVELKFFAGLTLDETGAALGTSRSGVIRTWRYARAWLRRELGGAVGGD